MGRVKELYMDAESSAADYFDNYLNDKDLSLQECRDKFEAEHGVVLCIYLMKYFKELTLSRWEPMIILVEINGRHREK